MIKLQIIREIQRRMPWILTTYGGIETFISYIKEALKIDEADSFNSLTPSQKSDLFNFLTLLIKYEKDILLISPWNLFIDLRQNINNTTTKDTINIDYPYQVFNLNGDLIYTVKTHFGVYGESRLDKHLILNSVNASGYFLKYRNYQGVQKIKLLLVNLHSKYSTINNQEFKLIENNSVSNLTIINNTGAPLNIYKTNTAIIKDTNFVFNKPENLHIITNNNIKTFNVSEPCYFLVDRPTTITQTKITYPSSNIIFINDFQAPFLVGSGIDVNILNKQYNKTIQFSNKPLDDVITITPFES